jgi:hypothetical protein
LRKKELLEGGIGLYKKSVQDEISLDSFVGHFFGPGWTAAPLPLTRPKVKDNYLELVLKGHIYAPMFKLVGVYNVERVEAAVTIQKMYRGWRVRMKYTFNPNTSFGEFLILRDFVKMGDV